MPPLLEVSTRSPEEYNHKAREGKEGNKDIQSFLNRSLSLAEFATQESAIYETLCALLYLRVLCG
jgi:hypothetical protein